MRTQRCGNTTTPAMQAARLQPPTHHKPLQPPAALVAMQTDVCTQQGLKTCSDQTAARPARVTPVQPYLPVLRYSVPPHTKGMCVSTCSQGTGHVSTGRQHAAAAVGHQQGDVCTGANGAPPPRVSPDGSALLTQPSKGGTRSSLLLLQAHACTCNWPPPPTDPAHVAHARSHARTQAANVSPL
jgi:hypothetical protein